jgi:hypothetical protein
VCFPVVLSLHCSTTPCLLDMLFLYPHSYSRELAGQHLALAQPVKVLQEVPQPAADMQQDGVERSAHGKTAPIQL